MESVLRRVKVSATHIIYVGSADTLILHSAFCIKKRPVRVIFYCQGREKGEEGKGRDTVR